MSDIIVVEDRVDMQCVRHVHLMSNAPLPAAAPQIASFGRNLGGEWVKDAAGVWHWRAEYPYCGAMDFHCEGWKKFRRLVVWSLAAPQGDGISDQRLAIGTGRMTVRGALWDAAIEFERLFGGGPQFAFMRQLPKEIENGHEVWGMTLIKAEWMLERCVAVGGRRF